MLRIDHNILRLILILIGLAGIILFFLPMLVHITNIGNVFGLAVSIVILAFAIWNRQISGFLDKINSTTIGGILLKVLGVFIVCGVLYCLIISCFMIHAAHKKPDDTPQAVIVLGCKVRGTVPSLMLSRRIAAAKNVLEQNPEMIAVVSGGKGDQEDISEAACMRNELVRMGIAEERILMEDRSVSTSENLRFSKEILEKQGITGSLLIATDGYHEMRAQYLAKREQLPDCYAVRAYTSWYLLPTYWVREWFGLAHAFVFGT